MTAPTYRAISAARPASLGCALALTLFTLLATPHAAGASEPQALPQLERVMLSTPVVTLSDFELTAENGKPRHFSELKGKPVLVYFGFTNCPDACPTAMGKLRALRDSAPEFRDAQVLLISVDGERDTPPVLKKYLEGFSPDFLGYTGEPAKVRAVAEQFSAPFFKGNPRAGVPGYLVEHSSQIYIVDRQGRLRAEFYDASLEVMGQVTRLLLAEGG
jgi:protein SCO1/2